MLSVWRTNEYYVISSQISTWKSNFSWAPRRMWGPDLQVEKLCPDPSLTLLSLTLNRLFQSDKTHQNTIISEGYTATKSHARWPLITAFSILMNTRWSLLHHSHVNSTQQRPGHSLASFKSVDRGKKGERERVWVRTGEGDTHSPSRC